LSKEREDRGKKRNTCEIVLEEETKQNDKHREILWTNEERKRTYVEKHRNERSEINVK
jgi:hypothetical protein